MKPEFWNHFPDWVIERQEPLERLALLIREWNEKINLISRKDICELESRHLLPCLAISRIIKFAPGTHILDVGTGGGFPGLPMAIIYPESKFTLVDSTGKKIHVVDDIANRLGLKNITTLHARAEEINERFDFVTGRAVAALPKFIPWVKDKIYKKNKNQLQNGIFYWKGGSLEPELKDMKVQPDSLYPLHEILNDNYFEEKYIAYFKIKNLKHL